MRAREFTINVPITIKINGDEDPEVSAPNVDQTDDTELQKNPVMVSPQQQELEMKKRIKALIFELKLLKDSFTRSTDQSGQKLPIALEAEINNKWDFVATPAEDQREKYSDEIADTERCIS